MMNPRNTAAWQALSEQASLPTMKELFEQDPTRAQRYQQRACGILLDYSKNQITDQTLSALFDLARQTDMPALREAMFRGEAINNTEQRAVLHTALRNMGSAPVMVDGQDVMPEVRRERARMADFAQRVREGLWTGFCGERITDVVNIGIGGSDLGPLMVCEALKGVADGPRVHFVSNVDGAHLQQTLSSLKAANTLFIIASKTFTTVETLINARSARHWLVAQTGSEAAVARHFVAVSTARERVCEFGIAPENMFGFWDWVGGRYSLWSAIGLPIMLSVGSARFDALLTGAYEMDQHFLHAPLEQNMPVILALISIFYINFQGSRAQLIAPYNQALHRFAAFLQQLDMESNGKSVRRDGQAVDYATSPVVWGEVGQNGQHAYFQMIHQGTRFIPIDFILALRQPDLNKTHHLTLCANALAQSAALMRGKTAEQVRAELTARGMSSAEIEEAIPHRVFEGNRPSNTLLLDELGPHTLGALIALYEHKVFVQGAIWGLNAYDQWGVELGKQLANGIEKVLQGDQSNMSTYDASTQALIKEVMDALK